jgi:hypothetical protein
MIKKLFIIAALFATITRASPILKRDLSSNNSSTSYSLDDLCSISHVRESLPLNGTLLGIEMIPTSVEVNVAESLITAIVTSLFLMRIKTILLSSTMLCRILPPSRVDFTLLVEVVIALVVLLLVVFPMVLQAVALMLVTMPSVHLMMRWFFLVMVLLTGTQLTCSLNKDWVK